MTRALFTTRLSGACAGLVLLALTTLGASAASPKRVLILDPFGRDVAPFSTAVSPFRSMLARELGKPVDFYEVPLDLARFAEPEGERPLAALLEGRIKSHPVDLGVTIGGAGAQFAARHRERLFPGTPVLVVASDPRFVPPEFPRADATLVTQKVNRPGMVEDILQVLVENASVRMYVLAHSQLGSGAVCGLPRVIAFSSTEEAPPGGPSALEP